MLQWRAVRRLEGRECGDWFFVIVSRGSFEVLDKTETVPRVYHVYKTKQYTFHKTTNGEKVGQSTRGWLPNGEGSREREREIKETVIKS